MVDKTMQPARTRRSLTPQSLLLVFVLLFVLGSYTFLVLRYSGNWNEGDTAILTRAVNFVNAEGSLVPDIPGPAYAHGFNFPAISIFLLAFSGFNIQLLQSFIYPLAFAVPLTLMLFVLYRSFLGSARLATLAAFFIFLQPEFLWVTWRGSHEKVTWLLILLAFFLLVKSFNANQKLSLFVIYVCLFYLAVFALVTTNTFFASSFTVALLFSFMAGFLLLFLRRKTEKTSPSISEDPIGRLLLITAACFILIYVFIQYIYPPANASWWALREMKDRLIALFLDVETQSTAYNPYEYVSGTWLNIRIYIILTLFNYMILLISFIVWLRGIPELYKRQKLLERDLPRLFLWLVYPAFAGQLALSLISDRTGVLGGNFQVRLFTPVMVVAIPLAVIGVTKVFERFHAGPKRWLIMAASVLAIGWFSFSVMIKVTNEPALSNNWLFYTTREKAAGTWVVGHTQASTVHTGIDARLWSALDYFYWNSNPKGVKFDGGVPEADTRYFIFSEVERLKLVRLQESMPYFNDEHQVYDNGFTQVFHRRPRTPYQY